MVGNTHSVCPDKQKIELYFYKIELNKKLIWINQNKLLHTKLSLI